MTWVLGRRGVLVLAVSCLLAVPVRAGFEQAKVTSVHDDGTIEVQLRGKPQLVRLLGVYLPPSDGALACFGRSAIDYLRRKLAPGTSVSLESDPRVPADPEGVLPRYVWIQPMDYAGLDVSGDLLRSGNAFVDSTSRARRLAELAGYEKGAAALDSGLWNSPCIEQLDEAAMGTDERQQGLLARLAEHRSVAQYRNAMVSRGAKKGSKECCITCLGGAKPCGSACLPANVPCNSPPGCAC